MELSHKLKNIYPNEILEVKGNATTLTIRLAIHVDSDLFIKKLKNDFALVTEDYTLYILNEKLELIQQLNLGR